MGQIWPAKPFHPAAKTFSQYNEKIIYIHIPKMRGYGNVTYTETITLLKMSGPRTVVWWLNVALWQQRLEYFNVCLLQPCPHYLSWETWRPCSATCGGGTTSRTRVCLNGITGQLGCDGEFVQTGDCNEQVPIDRVLLGTLAVTLSPPDVAMLSFPYFFDMQRIDKRTMGRKPLFGHHSVYVYKHLTDFCCRLQQNFVMTL